MDAEKPYLERNLNSIIPTSQAWFSRIGFLLSLMVGMVAAGICVTANAEQAVTLGWDANEAQRDIIGGYRLYYGAASRQYAGSNCLDGFRMSSTVSNLVEGRTYYFAVTAITTDGLESDYSAEITYTVPTTSPAPALSFTEVISNPAPASSSSGVQTDEVYVESGFNPAGSQTNPVNGVPRLDIQPFGQPMVAYAVGFEAPAGKACELQVSTDLEVWHKVFYRGNQPLAERLEFFDFPGGAETRRYYRVAVW